MKVLALDFSVIAGLFCITDLNFYQNLLCSTLTLLSVVIVIFVISKWKCKLKWKRKNVIKYC